MVRIFALAIAAGWTVPVNAQYAPLTLKGTITDRETGKPLAGAHIMCTPGNRGAVSSDDGTYHLRISRRPNTAIVISFVGYATVRKSLSMSLISDTLVLDVRMAGLPTQIRQVQITANNNPDTVFGSFSYCVADFEFYEDKIILLVYASRKEKLSRLMLQDKKGNILISSEVPGKPVSLYKDYDDRYYVLCKHHVYRVNIEASLFLFVPMSTAYFDAMIKPGIDMAVEKILFSDYRWFYPEFTYYSVWRNDTVVEKLRTISDQQLMRMYRFEYYYLNNTQRVASWKLAESHAGLDKYDAAALMTGFQHTIYYEPLFAPLFVVGDTILIFDHYADKLYRYDLHSRHVDSVHIDYHMNAGVLKWEKLMVKDESTGAIYALFQKNGYCYLCFVNTKSGMLEGSFKMSDKYAEKIKIKDGYVYYVYDPQDRYQTPYLYRETIRL